MHSNSLTGAIPTQLGWLTSVTRLYMHSNSLTGAIPTQLGGLTGVTELRLDSNSLTGAIPTQLGGLTGVTVLHVGFNSLVYPPPLEVVNLCSRANCSGFQGCQASDCYGAALDGAICVNVLKLCGSDPGDCSAFATAVPMASDPAQCSACNHGTEMLVLLPIALLLLACTGVALLRGAARKHPQHVRRWFSTVAIIYYHCLNITLIASIKVDWPPTMRQLARLLSLENVLLLPGAECVLPFDTSSKLSFIFAFLQATLTPLFVACVWLSNSYWLGPVLIFVFVGVCRAFDKLLMVIAIIDMGISQALLLVFSLLCGTMLLGPALHIRLNVKAYQRGLDTGSWHIWTMTPEHCMPSKIETSPLELDRRLAYIIHRFASHAPEWQFALWLRQVLLLVVGSRTISAALPSSSVLPWVQLGLSLLIVALSLFWHRRRQPYAFASQNALESGLLGSVVLLLLLAIPCHALVKADGTVSPALDAVMTALVLGSLAGAVLFALRDWRHQRKHGALLSLDDQLIGAPPP
jgi:hypothetical protein